MPHSFIVLVGVDVGTEDLDARLLLRAQSRSSGEADEHGVRQNGFHRRM